VNNIISHPTAAIDVDDDDYLPEVPPDPQADQEKRKRGRPKGSFGKTTNAERLDSCDFYFFRAAIEKIDPGDAADRYLAHRGTMDKRTAAIYARTLAGRMQRAINEILEITEKDQALKAFATLTKRDKPAFVGQSLEEFAERFDADMYSEAELTELYEEEYGHGEYDQNAESNIKAKRNALTWLCDRLARFPGSKEPVGQWIDKSIVKEVRKHGVLTLGDLIDWINMTGRRWFDKLENVGQHRARRLMIFLLQNENYFERGLNNMVRFELPPEFVLDQEDSVRDKNGVTVLNGSFVSAPVAPKHGDGVQMLGIVPIEALAWPPTLLGHDGLFRHQGPNTYGATNDHEAIQAWFKTLEEKSPATKDSYQRSVERLVLWAVVERRCSLSSLNTMDFTAFRDFLRDPPPHWCTRFPAMRYSPDWRPMRGPMGDASVQATMSAVATLFNDLLTCGYLSANAVASVRSAKRQTMKMDVMRSFAEEDLAVIRRTLDQMPEGMSKNRLRAALLLFQTSGMRRSEVSNLTWGQIAPLRVNNRISDSWAATFTGKGNKERIVPLQAATIEALKTHLADRMALVQKDKNPLPYPDIKPEDTPVLSILEYAQTERAAGKGDSPANSAREGNKNGALSASRIYMMLKRFFKEAAVTLAREGRMHGQADFEKASTHWLRHTFAHQALAASDRDLPAVQQILGHSDIGTTGHYVKADMASRIAAVGGVVGFDQKIN
jgi:site-specific recombinase XerD